MTLSIQKLLSTLMTEKSYLDNETYDIAWIARNTNVSYQVIKNITDGKSKSPSYHTIEAVAHAFDLSVNYFESQTENEALRNIREEASVETQSKAQEIAQRISLLSHAGRTDLMRMLEHIETSERTQQSQSVNAICIDDDHGSLLILRATLDDSNIRHEWYQNSQEGFEQLIQGKFNVGFIDLMMPGMSGYDISRYAREHKNPKINKMVLVAVTAYAVTTDQQNQIKDAGFDEIISKPFDLLQFPEWFAEFKEKYKNRL